MASQGAPQGREPRKLTLDEIVADQVARLLRKPAQWNDFKGGSVTQLAERLHISRAQVYDMIRARPGRPQREFRWNEIVRLARLFEVTVFELVLPTEDVVLSEGESVLGILKAGATPDDDVPDNVDDEIEFVPLDRADVTLALFGLDAEVSNPASIGLLTQRLKSERERRSMAFDELFERLREMEG